MTGSAWFRRGVITALLAAAVGLLVFAAGRDAEPGDAVFAHPAVEALLPAPGALETRQVTIGIDLETGWTGTLRVAGVEIPESQIDRTEPLYQYGFTPGAGKVLEELDAGQVCPEAIIWRLGETRAESQTVRWCFEVF